MITTILLGLYPRMMAEAKCFHFILSSPSVWIPNRDWKHTSRICNPTEVVFLWILKPTVIWSAQVTQVTIVSQLLNTMVFPWLFEEEKKLPSFEILSLSKFDLPGRDTQFPLVPVRWVAWALLFWLAWNTALFAYGVICWEKCHITHYFSLQRAKL